MMRTAEEIVELLLVRHERRPNRAHAASVSPDYANLRSASAVDDLHRALRAAE